MIREEHQADSKNLKEPELIELMPLKKFKVKRMVVVEFIIII